MGEYPGGMGAGNGSFEGMSSFTPSFFRNGEEIADDSHPRHQKKINLRNVSEHNCMVFTDLYCNIARQGKLLSSITSIDSYTM
jgi:hypothetical protein